MADPTRHIVIQSEPLAEEARQWLAERCDLRMVSYEDPAFHDALREAHGLVVRTYTRVDQTLLDHAPNLRVVGRAGVGLDNIDLDACRARNIQVVHTPQANTQAVVEYVVGLIADALRPRDVITQPVDVRTWSQLREQHTSIRQMSELTLGILGLGRIGKRLSGVANAIGFHVIYNDLLEIESDLRHGAIPVSVADLFQQSDVLSIHIDGRPSNRNFIDQALISQLKSDVVFINTSRGFVIENKALADFMRQCPTAQAYLDVHEPEPIDESYPLMNLPNVHLYPHLAARTEMALNNMSWVVKDVMAVMKGNAPKHSAT